MPGVTYKKIATRLIHSGEPRPRIQGAVIMPIFQSANYEYSGETDYNALKYIRLNNTPNHIALHQKLAALENAEAALVTASGMAAISTTLLTILKSGDHLLAQNTLYGGTHTFIKHELPQLGISFDFIDGDDPGSWEHLLRPNTKAIYVETLTNPLLQVANLQAVVDFAKSHNLLSLIDNTFASPINFRPAEWGYDLSLHSCTKYLNGHSDIVAGAVIGKAMMLEKITRTLNHLGGTLDPHACFLLQRGVKTLELRVLRQNESALQLTRFLEQQPGVAKVNYAGLESSPHHLRARELFDGFSGMFSFELKDGVTAAEKFMKTVRIPLIAPSLGGVETLLTRPAATSHLGLTADERQKIGISDGLIRVSVGIEDPQELMDDFERALRLAK